MYSFDYLDPSLDDVCINADLVAFNLEPIINNNC